MKRVFAIALAGPILTFAGCVITPVNPPRGVAFNNQKAPLYGGKETGSKEGRASAYCVLFLAGWGDSSLKKAAERGGISTIKHVDYQFYNILGFYQRYTTIVRGE